MEDALLAEQSLQVPVEESPLEGGPIEGADVEGAPDARLEDFLLEEARSQDARSQGAPVGGAPLGGMKRYGMFLLSTSVSLLQTSRSWQTTGFCSRELDSSPIYSCMLSFSICSVCSVAIRRNSWFCCNPSVLTDSSFL